MNLINKKTWDEIFPTVENPHILQTYEWGELKSEFGWTPYRFEHKDFVFQILMRNLPFGFKIAYIPKSKIFIENDIWNSIDEFCFSKKVIFLKYEPDSFVGEFTQAKVDKKFIVSKPIQPGSTIEIDLQGSESDWLERMKQKTRYNIKLAIKKGIQIEKTDDISNFHQLMLDTSKRDNFGVHSKKYYQLVYDLFSPSNQVALLIAKYNQIALAGIMVFRIGARSWYFYGASNNLERNRMPTYLLQFEAIKWAKSQGCTSYDLWGIPDDEEEILERDFNSRSDGLWGVYRFKRGFGGVIKRASPAYDRVYNPVLYKMINIFQRVRSDLS